MEFPHSLATPPSSGHRHGGTSTEMIPGLTEFYHREPHREGAPAPLCYLPSGLHPIAPSDRLARDWETILRPKVLSALSEYDVQPRSILPIHQRGTLIRGGETILINAPSAHHKHDNWFHAVMDMRQFFGSIGWTDLIVEISDREEILLKTWAIRRGEPIVEQWPGIRDLLLQQLKVNEGAALESMSIFRRGKSEERMECPLTIVLTASEVYGLMIIQNQIRQTLDSNGYDEIGLEIVRGKVVRNSIASIDPLCTGNHQLAAGMGVSIGPKDTCESGTLGGFIYLRYPSGERVQLGLTCYHVVRPGIVEHHKADCDASGIEVASAIGRAVTLTQPSKTDHEDIKKTRKESISSVKARIGVLESRLEDMKMKILYGIRSEDQAQPIRSAIERGNVQLSELKKLKSSSKEFYQQFSSFGHVFAASGFHRSPENHQMDWALIEIDEKRRPPNSRVPTHDKTGRELVGLDKLYRPTGPPTLETSVWKKGRTTEFTRGMISHLKADVFLDGMASGQSSIEWVIVDERGTRNWFFSEAGDSGSMVVNHDSQLVGLLIGGCEALSYTYMTPYAALVADIEQKTGGIVELEED